MKKLHFAPWGALELKGELPKHLLEMISFVVGVLVRLLNDMPRWLKLQVIYSCP